MYNMHPNHDKLTRCAICHGSGELMGSGMTKVDCDQCEGDGWYGDNVKRAEKKTLIDKKSKNYRNAIKKIKVLHDGISDEEAERIFQEEFEKL